MVTTVQRWGNSLAIRIPKAFAEEIQLAEDSDVEISLDGDRIIVASAKRKWKLDELLAQVTPSNKHAEVDWGERRGKETW